jgi:AcrR family transcriptional regulator
MARPRTNIEPRIIAAARATFAKTGVEASSLREIAKRAKTSIGMIYYYFPTKDDLFFAVIEDVYAKMLTDLEATLANDSALEQRLLAMYRRIGAASELEQLTLRLVVQEMLVSAERRARLVERFQRGHLGLVLKTLLQGVGQGKIRRDLNPAVLLFCTLAVGAAPQFALRALGNTGPAAFAPKGEALAAELLGVLFQGIGAGR